MADRISINDLVEDFAREIIECAMGDVPLGQKIEAFKVVSPYFVNAFKAGAVKEEVSAQTTFGDMKNKLKGTV